LYILRSKINESDKLLSIAKKSSNNQRKTMYKFTTNTTQYLPLCNPVKYEHTYGPFAVERYETTKKIKFMFISQKCSKYCNLSRFHINSFFIFFRVSYLSTAKGPYINLSSTSHLFYYNFFLFFYFYLFLLFIFIFIFIFILYFVFCFL